MKIQFHYIFLLYGFLSAIHSLSAMAPSESDVIIDPEEAVQLSYEQFQTLGQQLFALINKHDNILVKNLLEQGAHVDVVDSDNSTPLFYAIRSGNLEALKLCFKYGADIFHVNSRGGIPYYSATKCKASQSLLNCINYYEFLKINTCSLQSISQQINKSRMVSAQKTQTIQRLKKLMLSYQFLDAVEKNNYDFALTLISKNINLNVTDASNSTALFYALRSKVKNSHFIEQLLLSGADVFHVNNHGGTPYHSPCRHKAGQEIINQIEYYEVLAMKKDFNNIIAQLTGSLAEGVKKETINRLTQLHMRNDSSLSIFERCYGSDL